MNARAASVLVALAVLVIRSRGASAGMSRAHRLARTGHLLSGPVLAQGRSSSRRRGARKRRASCSTPTGGRSARPRPGARRVPVGCGRRSQGAPRSRRRQPDRRRPHRREHAHQGPRSGREGLGRRRAGHGGRHRPQPVRQGPAARRVPVAEDGVPQTIGHFSAEGSPLEIVVAIDVSESMTPAMPQLKNAVKKIPGGARPEGSGHAGGVQRQHVHADPARDQRRRSALRAVDRLAAWGGTALYDVIIRGVQQLSRQPGRRVLVVFSDGDDRTSHATITPSSRRCAPTTRRCSWWRSAAARGGAAQVRHRAAGRSERRPRAVRRAQRSARRAVRGDPRRAVEPVPHRLRVEQHEAQRLVARGQGRDARRRLHRARAAGLSRAGRSVSDAASSLRVRVVTPCSSVVRVVLRSGPVRVTPRRNHRAHRPRRSPGHRFETHAEPNWCSSTSTSPMATAGRSPT